MAPKPPPPIVFSPGDILEAKEMDPEDLYLTVETAEPRYQYICRVIEVKASGVILSAYYPKMKIWQQVEVPHAYRVIPLPQERINYLMRKRGLAQVRIKSHLRKSLRARTVGWGQNNPLAKTPEGWTVPETWGRAFLEYAYQPDAPARIVEFMRVHWPYRKTMFAKWLNLMRRKYNTGVLHANIPKPKTKVAPYPEPGQHGAPPIEPKQTKLGPKVGSYSKRKRRNYVRRPR